MLKRYIDKTREYIKYSKAILGLYFKSNRKAASALLLSIIFVSIIPFANAYVFKLIIDKIVETITDGNFVIKEFVPLLSISIILSLLNRVCWLIAEYVENIAYLDFGKYLDILVEQKYSTLGFEHYSNPKLNDLLNRVKETYTWRPLNFANRQLWIFQNIIEVISSATVIISLNIWIFLAIVLSAIPELLIHMKYGKEVWNIHVAKGSIRRDFWETSFYLKSERHLEEIRLFSSANFLINRIKKLYKQFLAPQKQKVKKKFVVSVISSVAAIIIFSIAEVYIIISAITQKITLGSLEFFNGRIYRLNESLISFFRNLGRNYEDLLYVKDLFQVLSLENEVKDHPKAVYVKTQAPRIEFKNVYFKYPNAEAYTLKNFNLSIKPREKIAFIGENGGGKTTIIRLLCRFFDVQKGEILIDGINIKRLKLSSWYKCLGILFQDFNRYEYTLLDNIKLGDIDKAYEEKLVDLSLKKSGALEFVKDYKKGLSTRLSKRFEGGVEPSIGQWQKVALARAFFRDAPILILDEPTSAIDAKAEAEIFKQLDKFEKDKTVIMVSHRFSTVRNADNIYIIDKGTILEHGSHDELMKKNGRYSKLFKLQALGYK